MTASVLPSREDRGYISAPRRLDGLAAALRLCVDREKGISLAQRFKAVPRDYVGLATRLNDRTEVAFVACRCGASVEVARLAECPGGCGRWFTSDDRGAWAAKL